APGCAGHIPTVSAWGLVLLALLLLIVGKLMFGCTRRVEG
ncbi:MAG: IPTL-CTERM sorting domain-containing protein, partial [Phycisphaerales bacterium]